MEPTFSNVVNIEDGAAPSEVIRTRIGVMTHLAPKGVLSTEDELQPLRHAVDVCLQQWETQVVIDLTAVPLLHSRALETLLDLQERLAKMGGWLKVSNVNPLIREILALTGLIDSIALVEVDREQQRTLQQPLVQRNVRLGDLLVEKGLLNAEKVSEAIVQQKKSGIRLGQIIIDKGWVTEKALLEVLSEQLSIPYANLRPGLYDPEVVRLLDPEVSKRLKMLPLFRLHDALFLATSDPQAVPSFGEVEERTNLRVRPVLARKEDIIRTQHEAHSGNSFETQMLEGMDDDLELVENNLPDDYAVIDDLAACSPVINMINSIIQRAVHDKASDIHIEPSQKKSRVRFRIDGLLYEVMTPRLDLHPALISRLKVMANLDIAERRLPQDGRIQVHTQGRPIDLRFSSLPGLYGEKVVLRVLDKNQAILNVSKLGMYEHNLDTFKNLLDQSYGLILVTGPTGSGKTTTLYSAINYLNSIEKNIVTIEDPVEYQLDIINQNPVKENIGLSFAKMLKHVLRQDPDVVMVGEIRERETAEIAVQAALTGHLVLSTLHTNDSVGAVTRMIDMGVEPYLLSSALIGVVAQRLVRGICPACKTDFLANPELIARYGWQEHGKVRLSKGRGCPECYDSGYRGRMGVHEIVETDNELQRLIISNPSREKLAEFMNENKVKTLLDDGLGRVLERKTTIEEISRVVNG
ncbi:MAG: Flp pilus assembly complex ATPase component TadA [Candidatus Thiodiazotropha sp.]|nr:Flp pilus assembly complex ATPase component TadA [Candidatus Thiodiazotropha sp.]MCM8883124.1 Flp pilus assembly complex ATPase component TadA [Candidatus Thiodiazotropha sp.]MCM8922279.1 Flp pilus assembly complex ATPase component TadA [Candidatus Thiodiazotropha sp.]